MKVKSTLRIVKFHLLALLLLVFSAGLAQAQKSGAYYLGDSDGNGIIEIPDLSTLAGMLGNPGQPDPAVYAGHPQSRFRQELDGNGLIEVPDYSILLGWVTGNYSNRPGNPDQLALDGDTHLNLNFGDSVTLSAYALSPASQGAALRTGLGVIFKIDPSGTCTTAQIFGYDVAGGATINIWRANAAYHYTLKPDVPDNGRASVRVNANGCSNGKTIKVEVYIPDDGEAGVVPGRFPDKLPSTPQYVTINVRADYAVMAVDVQPGNTNIEEGTTITFRAICTLENASTIDCTESYGSTNTLWYAIGDLEQGKPGNHFQAEMGNGLGIVTAFFDMGGPDLEDAGTVHIWDITTPDTYIDSAPPALDNNPDAVFTFSSNEKDSIFWCSIDSIGYNPCVSPETFAGLSDGTHYLEVRAIDAAWHIDPTPATYTWDIDATPPVTNIISNPPNPSTSPDASFTFSCTGGPCSFECKMDSGSFSSCDSPKNYTGLGDGSHTFWARATDLVGNVEPAPPSYTWTIDATPPDTFIDSNPPNPIHVDEASFVFHCTGGPCTFECDLDSGGWGDCVSPKDYSGLSDASHTFRVRAKDDVGNVDLSPASYTWTISLNNYWLETSVLHLLPDPRYDHTAVWTGTEMIVWGGYNGSILNTGARYNPTSDSWTPTSTTNVPEARQSHTAVWTGTKMIVWGGASASTFNTGGAYDPSTDSWTATTTTGAPSARYLHTAVWTGTEMVIWGGRSAAGSAQNSGGKYNPSTQLWSSTSTGTNCPTVRYDQTAVWTGTQMVIWGGYSGSARLNTGGRYTPSSNTWLSTSTGANVPSIRTWHTAVWTGAGNEMIVWGGAGSSPSLKNDGGKYNPSTDTWATVSTTNAPVARFNHAAVWSGTSMIVWGGDGASYYKTGGTYDPAANSWVATSTTNAPSERYSPAAVWTGDEMIVWGGYGTSPQYKNDGGRYDPLTNSWVKTGDYTTPSIRMDHSAVWTGTEMIVWGGNPVTNTGGRYNPSTDSWTATTTTNAPAARSNHTAVWAGTEMIVWGGYDGGVPVNTGGKYDPSTDSWTATATSPADPNTPLPRYLHTAVWTGTVMVVWGGMYNGAYYLNDGGRYDPATDSWASTTTFNGPATRAYHSAVWTGTEMIVWGGFYYDGLNGYYLSGGGRYDPSTDSWNISGISGANPSYRRQHTAVWTGTVMIVWGGYYYSGGFHWYYNDGGQYDPITNSWTATSTTNAPSVRRNHTAVWDDDLELMIVWGGYDGSSYLATGGRYDPATDSWTETATDYAPSARELTTPVWTGDWMVVFGGSPLTNTGGIYIP